MGGNDQARIYDLTAISAQGLPSLNSPEAGVERARNSLATSQTKADGIQRPAEITNDASRSPWIGTIQFSEWLGIHPQTVRALRKLQNSPWHQGIHYRQTGVTGRGPMQWHRELAEKAFTEFHRTPAIKVETFSRTTHPIQR